MRTTSFKNMKILFLLKLLPSRISMWIVPARIIILVFFNFIIFIFTNWGFLQRSILSSHSILSIYLILYLYQCVFKCVYFIIIRVCIHACLFYYLGHHQILLFMYCSDCSNSGCWECFQPRFSIFLTLYFPFFFFF